MLLAVISRGSAKLAKQCWTLRKRDQFETIWEKQYPVDDWSIERMELLLQCMACAALSEEEIIDLSLQKESEGQETLLHVSKVSANGRLQLMVGEDSYFIADRINE